MQYESIRAVAFDLDGTLTQHKTGLEPFNRDVLDALSKKYRLLMVGAGNIHRIFHQLGEYPIDVIGNYGLQYGRYNPTTKQLDTVFDHRIPCNRGDMDARITALRQRFGFTD